jgi:hypothetical protein
MSPLPTRREHESVEIDLGEHGRFHIRVGWHPVTGAPCDVFLTGKKPNDAMHTILQELGIAASKLMQGRAAIATPPRLSLWARARNWLSKVLQGKEP